MGCDIHCYAEKRSAGIWTFAGKAEDRSIDDEKWLDLESIYPDRNYDLFAMLANVRNGHGFAGIQTGEGFIPIAAPRGMPADASKQVRTCYAQWDVDAHSASWFTVAELMAYDWTRVTRKQGLVTATEYEDWSRWKRQNQIGPANYCGDVSGQNIRKVSNKQMDALLAAHPIDYKAQNFDRVAILPKPLTGVYTLVEWETPYHRAAGEFLSETMPKLWRLGRPDEVRIVFWFDN